MSSLKVQPPVSKLRIVPNVLRSQGKDPWTQGMMIPVNSG